LAITPGIDLKIENLKFFELILGKTGIKIEELIEEIPIEKPLPYDFIKGNISKENLQKMWNNYKDLILNGE